MPAAIAGFTPTVLPSTSTGQGFDSMTGGDFMKVMLAQLQQQDPLNPTNSDQMLTQLSQIKALESNTALATNLNALTLQQSIGAGGNLIGKTVNGLDSAGNQVSGNVTSVQVRDKNVYLELDSAKELPMANITNIAPAALASTSTTTPVTNPLASLLKTAASVAGGTE